MNAAAVMADVVTRLVAAMEAGAADWSMPWRTLPARGWPTNAVTGNRYRGANVLALTLAAQDRGYTTNRWATFKQWAADGGQVRRGEHGTHAIYWHTTPADPETTTDDAAGEPVELAGADRVGWARAFTVFNADQLDGPPTEPVAVADPAVHDEQVEAWFAAIPARVIEAGDRAYYHPASDTVHVPPFDQFHTPEAGWATRSHELAHWTGNRDRLAREFGRRFGDRAYAGEELVAELSAAFTCTTVGIGTVERLDHAAYLNHWCQMLAERPATLWAAASKAQAATELLDRYSHPEVEQ